jgi:hypothetical protein
MSEHIPEEPVIARNVYFSSDVRRPIAKARPRMKSKFTLTDRMPEVDNTLLMSEL